LRQPLFQLTDAQVRCQLALDDGSFAAAEAAAEEAASWSEALPHASGGFGVQMFSIRREQGRLDEVRPVVEAVARRDRSASTWRAGLAALYAELGHLDEGTALLDQLVAEDLSTIPHDSLWTGALSFLADACVATNHRAAAELVHRELAPSTGVRVAIVGLASYGAADRYLGRLAEVRGRPDEAERYLEAALRLDERTGSPTWTAHSSYALGRFLARRGRRDDRSRARELIARAYDTTTTLGMATMAARCEAVVQELGPRGSDAGVASPLTRREASVLQLVAQGRTNRQIGEQLHVSEHTVANHIRAILIKTGSANRAEAAAWAQRSGLLPL
jgi:DNA-binding CsgD family transcriptional regulator